MVGINRTHLHSLLSFIGRPMELLGVLQDAGERHELSLGSFEMSVTKEYKRNQRDGLPPAIVLVLDISQRSYNNGVEGFLSSHVAGE